jgi:hypothetical protein
VAQADGSALPAWLESGSGDAPLLAGVPYLPMHQQQLFVRVQVTGVGDDVFAIEVLPALAGGGGCAMASVRATLSMPHAEFSPQWQARVSRALGAHLGSDKPTAALHALDFAPGMSSSPARGGLRGTSFEMVDDEKKG